MKIPIGIIDAPCGAGKSTAMIKQINRHPEKKHIVCTPLLSECDRYAQATEINGNRRLIAPDNYGHTKAQDFEKLIRQGQEIVVTHSTFMTLEQNMAEFLGGYELIVDEAINCLSSFNDLQEVHDNLQQWNAQTDIEDFLLPNHLIDIDERHRVHWTGSGKGTLSCSLDRKFSVVERYAKAGQLYCMNNRDLYVSYPVDLLNYFGSTTVMTYRFEWSQLYYGMLMNDMSFEKFSVNDEWEIVPYTDEADRKYREFYGNHVHIDRRRTANAPYENRTALSKNYYKRASAKTKDELKGHIRSFFDSLNPKPYASEDAVMWTCPKEYEKKLAGKGYTKSTPHKAVYSEREWEQAKKCFVPCNARATNIYSTRWALANATNIFIQPDMRIYFESGNGERIASGKPPIIVNEDGIATGIMIQWVNRSAIRNGKDVYLYLPSGRMRGLHDRFINNQI